MSSALSKFAKDAERNDQVGQSLDWRKPVYQVRTKAKRVAIAEDIDALDGYVCMTLIVPELLNFPREHAGPKPIHEIERLEQPFTACHAGASCCFPATRLDYFVLTVNTFLHPSRFGDINVSKPIEVEKGMSFAVNFDFPYGVFVLAVESHIIKPQYARLNILTFLNGNAFTAILPIRTIIDCIKPHGSTVPF